MLDARARLQHLQLRRLENGDGIGQRFEVVEEAHAPDAGSLRQRGRIDDPRHVRHLADLRRNRAGDADAGGVEVPRLDVPGAEEGFDHRLESVVVEGDELTNLDHRGSLGRGREKPKECLSAADVSRENHG